MKNLILLITFTLFSITLSADCSSRGMIFYPKSKTISMSSLFIIEGYGNSQKTIISFNQRDVFLEDSHGERIKLNLLKIYKGQFNLIQAIFKPSQLLAPNTTYTLKFTNQSEIEAQDLLIYNHKTNQRENVYWKTNNLIKVDEVDPFHNINFDKTEVIHYGCGPAVYAIFSIDTYSENEVWYKVELEEMSSGKKNTFYITNNNNELKIGHEMCSGGFRYEETGKYKAIITPMNIEGVPFVSSEFIFNSPLLNENVKNR